MEDTLKGNNSASAEKSTTGADINETLQMREVVNLLQHGLAQGLKLMWFQLFFIAALMVVFLAGLFLVLTRMPSTSNVAHVTPPASNVAENILPTPPVAPPANIPETQPATTIPAERQEIQGILDQLRKAQLAKDIDLFFHAYSPTFPNLAEKKEGLLKTWQKYNYLDLNFNLENIQRKDAHTIVAKVACDLTLEDVLSKKKTNLVNDYNIYFSDASGKWLIQGLAEVKKNRKSNHLSSN